VIINNNAVKIDSNVQPSKALNFGISDVRLVVDILSKLYAYPIRTLVQEYICNGRDAMREAGTWGKLPIEITVPNTLDPVFKVRDFGVGISPDRMENIFVNYGSSTKRNTNTQTGGFGIGAKSAFSYTDSFTVTSFVDGTKYVYVAHLGDEGGVNLISKENTNQHNGVEISIGVKPKDISEFRNAVQRCVRFWTEPIKFLGSKDIHQFNPILTLGNMTVYDGRGNESRTIYLIDGIEYDIMQKEGGYYYERNKDYLNTGNSIVALNVPNGHFKIASSRERLETNDDNKSKQDKMISDCRNKIETIITSRINNLGLPLKIRLENKQTYSWFAQVSHIELDLGNGFKLNKDSIFCPSVIPYRYVRRGRRHSSHIEIAQSTVVKLTATIYTSTDKNNNLARKLNYYLESNKDQVLIHERDVSNIPFQDILFTNRMDADALPMPPKKSAQRTQKSTRDAICWSISSDGTRSQWTVEKLNNSKDPVVYFEDGTETDEIKKIAEFIQVIAVPKCNKDLVLKKGMTLEQGKKYLLSKNKSDVLGFRNLPHNWNKVNVLKKFKTTNINNRLRDYLVSNSPDLSKDFNAMNNEYEQLQKKYPLIKVLCGLPHYQSDHIVILIEEINKQSKENA
jgi:hypothetical protein